MHCNPPVFFKYALALLSFGTMLYFISNCMIQYYGKQLPSPTCIFFEVFYLAYPTQTRVLIRLNRSQVFPAVTICSGTPLRFDRYLPALVSFILTNNLSSTPSNITREEIYRGAFHFMVDLFNRNRTSEIFSYGFQLEDILLDCVYNGYDCRSLWTRTISPVLGNCYTFNRQTLDRQTNLFRINDVNGQTQSLHIGLIATFYLNIELYFPTLEYGLGLIGILHHPDEQPLIRYSGKRFAPGFEHSLVYEKAVSTYLGSPYTACTQGITEDMRGLYGLFDNNTDYIYSETVCLELCYQTYMFEQCGCIYPVFFFINQVRIECSRPSFPLFQLTIDGRLRWVRTCVPWTASYQCTIEARQRIANDGDLQKLRCAQCQSQCVIHKYAGDLSSLKGPSDSQKNYYTKLILSNSSIPIQSDFAPNASYYIERNYLKLSVLPLNAYVTTYDEKATYTSLALVSDLGGQIGL